MRSIDLYIVPYLLVVLLIFAGCKEPSPLEVQLPSESENELVYIMSDTTTVYAKTVKEDPLSSDSKPYALLGCLNDSAFGYSHADFFTQIKLSSSAIDAGSGFTADSAVLILAYKGFYGYAAGSWPVAVYEIKDAIIAGNTYYSSVPLNIKTPEIAWQNIAPQADDTIVRIRMNNVFINNMQTAGTSVFAGDDAFKSFFKGLFVTTITSLPVSILYFDLLSPATKITLWYHNNQYASLSYDFLIDNNCARINRFAHDYNGTTVQAAMDNTSVKQTPVYIQAMAGVKTLLVFPFFDNWKQMVPVSVAHAELVAEVSPGTTSLPPPPKLYLAGLDTNGTIQSLYDVLEGENVFGGSYNSATRQYTFTISRYIQQKINGDINDAGLYLYIPNNSQVNGSASSATRAVIDAAKIKLKIVYTRL